MSVTEYLAPTEPVDHIDFTIKPEKEYEPGETQKNHDANAVQAVADGFEVLTAADNMLFLDLDDERDAVRFLTLMPTFEQFNKVVKWRATYSKSGPPNIHVIIFLQENIHEAHRVTLQAALGSDPKKEMCSVQLMRNGVKGVVRLYKPQPCAWAHEYLERVAYCYGLPKPNCRPNGLG